MAGEPANVVEFRNVTKRFGALTVIRDVTFSVARLFFSYGLVNSLFLPLLAGASVFLTPDRPDVRHTLEVVQRYRPTLF